ncbi:cyclophilin-like fold protein [Plantibacter sp. YIM 135347]|uniref:cyclophilin-like fold protein n=1 Tax=Plantibacter sp. YIM 135347 TaxID=3423919 RepID=UPI003D333FC4
MSKDAQHAESIEIVLNGVAYTVRLNGTEAARELAQSAPFRTSLSQNAGNHYWGSLPHRLSTLEEAGTSVPREGRVYYADHLTAIAFYFEDSRSIAPYVLYPLGDITDDLSALRTAGNWIKLQVS